MFLSVLFFSEHKSFLSSYCRSQCKVQNDNHTLFCCLLHEKSLKNVVTMRIGKKWICTRNRFTVEHCLIKICHADFMQIFAQRDSKCEIIRNIKWYKLFIILCVCLHGISMHFRCGIHKKVANFFQEKWIRWVKRNSAAGWNPSQK